MPKALATSHSWGRVSVLLATLTALLAGAGATAVGCDSEGAGNGLAQTAAGSPEPDESSQPRILSLAPSDSPTADVHDLVLSWQPIPGIDRFALCETTPSRGTECEDHVGVAASVTVPGPTVDPRATGTWLKYLWLQYCDNRECSRPPVPAGAIAHRVAFGTNAWNLVVVVRRLEGDQIEVFMANASRKKESVPSTLIARTPAGLELGRCEDIAPGDWCGPLTSTLLSNEVVAEQVYGGVGLTVEFPVTPSSTGPQ